jgi:hypothetical protein
MNARHDCKAKPRPKIPAHVESNKPRSMRRPGFLANQADSDTCLVREIGLVIQDVQHLVLHASRTSGVASQLQGMLRNTSAPYPLTNFLNLIRCGWSASAPFRLCRSASYSL